MRSARSLFVYALIALFVGAVLQSGEYLIAAGVKPNLVLVLLAVFSLFTARLSYFGILAVCGVFFLDFTPGISWEMGGLLCIAMLFFYARNRFLTPGPLAAILFTMLGTILFYLLISPALLYDGVAILAKEILYNGLLSVVIFVATGFIYEKKGGSAIR